MLNLPPNLVLQKPSDPDAQRIYPNIERAVNPVLAFLRGSFDNAVNGGLRVLRPIIVSALTGENLTVSKIFESLGDANFRGGSTSYQFHIVQGQMFVLKNPDNTGGTLTVNGDTTLNGKANLLGGINAPTGLKTIAGQVGITGNLTGGQFYNLGAPYFGNTWYYKAPFAGSMVALSISVYTQTASTMNIYSTGFNNGETTTTFSIPAAQIFSFRFNFARGACPFNVDSNLLWKMMMPASNTNVSLCVTPILELAT